MNFIEQAKFPVRLETPRVGGHFNKIDNSYKAIIREDTNELIDIRRPTYELVKNETVLNNALEAFKANDIGFTLGGESFVNNKRIRLQFITNEQILDNDDRSKFCIYLSNSYDGSSGVRFDYGIVRLICTNGLTVKQSIESVYAKHTKNIQVDKLIEKMSKAINNIPNVIERVNELTKENVTPEDIENVQEKYTKKLLNYSQLPENKNYFIKNVWKEYENRWVLLNMITYFISHYMRKRSIERYQSIASNQFQI